VKNKGLDKRIGDTETLTLNFCLLQILLSV
jgi:hypothetical protein